MTFRRLLALAPSLAVALAATPATAGLLIVQTNTTPGAATTTTKMYLTPEAARITTGPHSLIYRKDQNVAWMVQGDSFMTLDKGSARAVGKQVDSQMAAMEDTMAEALAKVPADKRAMVEEMMRQQGVGKPGAMGAPPAAPARPSGPFKAGPTGQSVGKWTCDVYERGGAVGERVCATELDELGITRADLQIMFDAAKYFREISSEFGQPAQAIPMADEKPGYPGYPVNRKEIRGGTVSHESQLVEVTRQDFDPALFARPNLKERTFGPMP